MRRPALGLGAALCAVVAACSIDFVAPSPASPIARLTAHLDLGTSPGDSLSVQAQLDPGTDLSGVLSHVPDPRLVLLDRSLAADSTYPEERLLLTWTATLATDPLDTAQTVLVAPRVEGRDTPEPVRFTLRRQADGSERGRSWNQGQDLILPLRHASGDPGLESTTWNLTVTSWDRNGSELSLVSAVVRTPIGDTLRIPTDWLPPLDVDSLRARLRYTRTFSTTGADRSYREDVTVNQVLSWMFTVR
jgi:hypothetical protein